MAFLITKAGVPGLTYKQARRPEFNAVTRGARALSDDWHEEARAYALVLPENAVFSHGTAATIQRLPVPRTEEKPFCVTTAVGSGRIRREGLKEYHRTLLPEERDRWHYLPVTSPLRTLRDLATELTVNELVVIADHLLHHNLCTLEDLHDNHGRRHKKELIEVANLARYGSCSPEETRLRLSLVEAGLPMPTLNEDIVENGIWVGRGDLVWRRWRTIADYDGEHHKTAEQRHQDSQTRDDYADAGWRHITITRKMTEHDRIQRVKRALVDNGWRSGE